MRRTFWLWTTLLMAACGGSTSDDPLTTPTTKACTPGQQVACACADGTSGAQACRADGAAYETCVCGGAAGAAGNGQAGTAGSAGQAGGAQAGTTQAGAGGVGGSAGTAGTSSGGAAGAGGSGAGAPPTCAAAAANPSSLGCEFWAADLDQQDGGGNDPASEPWAVLVMNPQPVEVTVTIELNEQAAGAAPAPKVIATKKLAPGASAELVMPTRELDCGAKPNDYAAPGTCLSSRAMRVTATAPVSAHQVNAVKASFSNDASMLLPASALGKRYRVLGVAAGHPVPIDFPGSSKIIDRATLTIIGTQPDTQVTVTPTWRVKTNGPITSGAIGAAITVTLGPFDVLNLETDDATSTEASTNPLTADFSGTTVVATKPVSAFSGAESASAPSPAGAPKPPGWSTSDTCCLDHVEEQLLPMDGWGKKHVVPRSKVRGAGFVEPDVLRFVGGDDAATVTTTLPHLPTFTLKPGEVLTTYTTTDAVIDSSAPIGVAIMLVAQQLAGTGMVGDPSLAIIPPVEQHASDVSFVLPDGWATEWASIAIPAGATFTIDGAAPSACVAAPALGGFTFARCPLSSGGHRVVATAPFVAMVGGYSSASSFLTIAGVRASAL